MQENQNQENMRTEVEVVDNTDYIEAIQSLKQNSVDKAKYDALRLENKKLIQSLVNGEVVENPFEKKEVHRDEEIAQLRKELFGDNNKSMTNLEY